MTSEINNVDLPLSERCWAVSKKLISQYQWGLLTSAVLTDQMIGQLQDSQDLSERKLRATALNIYSLTLYEAVCKPNKDATRHQAFTDIYNYLYAVALYRWHSEGLAEELAQDALSRIWEHRMKCEKPGAFLYFCLMRLWNAYSDEQRANAKNPAHDLPDRDDSDDPQHEITDTTLPTPEEAAICQELWERWLTRFGELHKTRASRQLDMVYYKYFLGLTDEEIVDQLAPDNNPNNIQTLRVRGLSRLHSDPELSRLSRQLLELCL